MKKIKHVSFSMRDDILAVDESNDILLKGGIFYENEEYGNCVISFSKRQWNRLFNEFLKMKRDYFLRCNEFCGVDSAWLIKWKITGTATLLDSDPENPDNEIYVEVPFIRCISGHIEMEHG